MTTSAADRQGDDGMRDDARGVNPVEYVLTWHPIVGGEPPVKVPLYDFVTGLEDELGEFQLHKREVAADSAVTRPILRRIDCGTGCPVTWAEVPDDAPRGCPWCAANYLEEQHARCDHRGHARWRSSRLAAWLVGKASVLGVINSCGTQYGRGCPGCLVGIRWRGRRSYMLGWQVTTWRCLLRNHHWPGEDIGGVCAKCAPCPTCGSKTAGHNPGCADDAWAQPSREDAPAGAPNHGGAEASA
jgi:hypothetical protein